MFRSGQHKVLEVLGCFLIGTKLTRHETDALVPKCLRHLYKTQDFIVSANIDIALHRYATSLHRPQHDTMESHERDVWW